MAYKATKTIIAIIVIVILSIIAILINNDYLGLKNNEMKTIEIKGQEIKVEVANDSYKRYKGLSGKKYLGKDKGMLFIFPDKEIKRFVMREMNFPLDILFIDDNKIIKIAKNLPPEGKHTTKVYDSGKKVNYVLELNANYCDQHDIKVEDTIIIK